jgi:dihydroorotate dehydrogenase (NAD+) catalytic subunit
VIGVGGIETAEDVLEYLLVGATAVQVGTAHFSNPRISVELAGGVENFANRLNIKYINDLRGHLLT